MFTKLYLHSVVECGLDGSAYTQKFKNSLRAHLFKPQTRSTECMVLPKHGACVVFRTNLKGFLTKQTSTGVKKSAAKPC